MYSNLNLFPFTFVAVSYSPGGVLHPSGSVSVSVNDDVLFIIDSPLTEKYIVLFYNRLYSICELTEERKDK